MSGFGSLLTPSSRVALLSLALAGAHCGASKPDAAFVDGTSERRAGSDEPAGDASDGGAVAEGVDASRVSAADADAAPDAASALPPMTIPSFIVGYNEGWFGSGFGSDLSTNWDPNLVKTTLDGVVKGGGHVVRVWLFELNEGITLGSSSPQIQSVDAQMLAHVGDLLDMARARGLWVYLTLLDGNGMPQESGPLRDFYWNLLNDKFGEGQAFQNHVLAPLLGVLDAHKDVVYGIDLVNEIEAPRIRSFWPDPFLGPRAFIQRTTSFIKAKSPWVRVTTTAGWDVGAADIATGFFSGLGLDFYDLHVYADGGAIAGSAQVCQRAAQDGVPVILGEFGQRSHVADDAMQKTSTEGFLQTAKASCFKGALAWRFDAAEQWWNYARSDGSYRPAVAVMQQYGAQP